MAQLNKEILISEDHIREYRDEHSDFAFELKIARKLRSIADRLKGRPITDWMRCSGGEVQHGGVYQDPVTFIRREFDIRATFTCIEPDRKRIRRLVLSVECKNIREHFPLVIHRERRRKSEAFFNRMVVNRSGHPNNLHSGEGTLYSTSDFVGKSSDQVGLDMQGKVMSHDRDVFPKISHPQ